MDSTSNPVDPVTVSPSEDNNDNNVWILSTVLPFCAFMLIIVAVRRLKRRVDRAHKIIRTSVYVIPDKEYQPRSIPYEPKSIRSTAIPIPTAGSDKKHKKKMHHRHHHKIITKTNIMIQTAVSFPREPVYKSQQTPSYIVPFSALPPNFDFSLPNVEVYSDFVFIKDLDVLQTYWYESEDKNEEHKKQSSFTPSFS